MLCRVMVECAASRMNPVQAATIAAQSSGDINSRKQEEDRLAFMRSYVKGQGQVGAAAAPGNRRTCGVQRACRCAPASGTARV